MGQLIAKLRKEKGLSQVALSAKSKVSRTIISGLESGRIEQTTIGTLRKIAIALDVDISYFFEELV